MMLALRIGSVCALAICALVMLPGNSGAQQMACSTTVTTHSCGYVVTVGDPNNPCIERDGKAYCPVDAVYYPDAVA